MQHLTSRGKPFRDKTPPTHRRNFFQFLFKCGKTNVNLAPSVPRIAHRHTTTLPRHLTSEQVETVIAAVKADTAIGWRNYAMVLLLARLGLRAAEVIAIQIDDISMMICRARAADACVSVGADGAAVADGAMRAMRPAGMTSRPPRITGGSGDSLDSSYQTRADAAYVCLSGGNLTAP
jgi:hypothetical protein